MAADQGGSAQQLQEFFGWKSPNMTSEYISTSKAALGAMTEKLKYATEDMKEKYVGENKVSVNGKDKVIAEGEDNFFVAAEEDKVVVDGEDGGINGGDNSTDRMFSKVVLIHGSFSGSINL